MARLDAWRRADRVLDAMTLLVGVAMILYVGCAVFGLVASSARHYAAFAQVSAAARSGIAPPSSS